MKKLKYYIPSRKEEVEWIVEGFCLAFLCFQVELILMCL